jgi:hypothetical protein
MVRLISLSLSLIVSMLFITRFLLSEEKDDFGVHDFGQIVRRQIFDFSSNRPTPRPVNCAVQIVT